MNKKLLQTFKSLTVSTRLFKTKFQPGGIRYPGGIVYYPRFPGEKEPECTPSKLFRVERIKPVKGQPWWHVKILREMKIDENVRVAVVKNTPETNGKLWRIKHLVKIIPITFPYGEPTEEDIKHTILKENGQCIVTKTLAPSPQRIEALEAFTNNPKKMDSTTIKKDSRRKWDVPLGGGF